jgi:hypothetical protein
MRTLAYARYRINQYCVESQLRSFVLRIRIALTIAALNAERSSEMRTNSYSLSTALERGVAVARRFGQRPALKSVPDRDCCDQKIVENVFKWVKIRVRIFKSRGLRRRDRFLVLSSYSRTRIDVRITAHKDDVTLMLLIVSWQTTN